jgi:hypothetical protein
MSTRLYLESCAALLPEGILTHDKTTAWKNGQAGPSDVTRDQVLDRPYLSFGKLSLPDRLAFSAASLALAGTTIAEPESAAICLGLPAGSLSTDLRYMESVIAGFPSPAVFSATLPSSAITDIAIFFGLKGENRVIAGGADSGLIALECGCAMLTGGKAGTVVVLSVNALERQDRSSPLVPPDFDSQNRAYAFLLSTKPQPGGLAYGFDVSFEYCNKDLTDGGGEKYFYQLVKLVQSKKCGAVEGSAAGLTCRITLSKEP